MENPDTWGEAERVVDREYERWWRDRENFVCGLSLARRVTDALRDAGLLMKTREELDAREIEVIPDLKAGDIATLQFRGHEFTGEVWVDDKGRNRVGCWFAEGKHFVRKVGGPAPREVDPQECKHGCRDHDKPEDAIE